VLGGALVTERIIPGAISMDHGAKYDPIIPGVLDREELIILSAPVNHFKKLFRMVTSGFLLMCERLIWIN